LHVVWDLTSLLGLTDHCALLRDSATMLPPSAMRDLLAGGGRIRRMVIDPETGEQLDLTPTSWPLSQTDGRAHRQPVVLTLTNTARWDDLPDDIRAATDACDPYLTAILRELLDHPLTADDLDNTPDAEQPSPALAEHVTSRAGHRFCARARVDAWSGIGESAQGAKRPSRSRHSRGASTERPHRIKTFTDWTVRQVKRGWEWTSPTGRRYTIEPHDYRLGP
jgi:hypothetical protein